MTFHSLLTFGTNIDSRLTFATIFDELQTKTLQRHIWYREFLRMNSQKLSDYASQLSHAIIIIAIVSRQPCKSRPKYTERQSRVESGTDQKRFPKQQLFSADKPFYIQQTPPVPLHYSPENRYSRVISFATSFKIS